MKISASRGKTISYGNKEKKSFKVSTKNSKFFRVMSDTLYSDKIGSIIRELSSNAVDAQRSQKTLDKPYELFLPCLENPRFCIRDYGTGLPPNLFEDVFVVYFESSKDESEEDIGGFGLGAKTPFSYTDTFVVRSYYEGKIYTYVVAFSGDEPEYEMTSIEDTDLPSGLEIYFDVEPKDFAKFQAKTFEILLWSDYIPNIWFNSTYDENGFFQTDTNNSIINYREKIIEAKKSLIENDKVIIADRDYQNSFKQGYQPTSRLPSKLCVIQGGVLYPVSTDISEKVSNFSANYSNTQKSICIKCKIGEISLTPSRESIEANEKTINNIEKHIDEIEKQFDQHVKSYIQSKKDSKFSVARELMRTLNIRNHNNEIKDIIHFSILFNQKSKEKINKFFQEKFDEGLHAYVGRYDKMTSIYNLYPNDKFTAYNGIRSGQRPKKIKNDPHSRFSTYGYTHIVALFREAKSNTNITAFFEQIKLHPDTLALVFDTYKSNLNKNQSKSDYLQNMYQKFVDYLEASQDDIKIYKESDYFSKIEKQKNIYEKNTYSIFYTTQSSSEVSKVAKNSIESFLDKKNVYVIKKGHNECILQTENKNAVNEISTKRNNLASLFGKVAGLFDYEYDNIIYVNKKELKDITKHSNIAPVSFYDAMMEMTKNEQSFLKKIKEIFEFTEFEQFKQKFNNYSLHELKVMSYLGEDNKNKELDSLINKYKEKLNNTIESTYIAYWKNLNIENYPSPRSITHFYSSNTAYFTKVLENIKYSYLDNTIINGFISTKIINTIKECIKESQAEIVRVNVDDFINDENYEKYPLLKIVKTRNSLDLVTFEDLIEYIKHKKTQKKMKIDLVAT